MDTDTADDVMDRQQLHTAACLEAFVLSGSSRLLDCSDAFLGTISVISTRVVLQKIEVEVSGNCQKQCPVGTTEPRDVEMTAPMFKSKHARTAVRTQDSFPIVAINHVRPFPRKGDATKILR